MNAEERLIAAGIPFEETDFGREDEPDVSGCILVRQLDHGMMMQIAVRPGLAGQS
ncbi:hypothetical protein ACWDSJ_27875 [Nocardia sp. NPDC003482]